ncbi:hypothetical protein FOMPIDRAFT_1049099 [Fomitopsis schrenkii]|uniref:Uncharacterized protein n=1 Tax=Fomitopsis schrenkii TaxID=2126942 RepID=S8ED04_FOMSC|nr:hypothetical protein FOMPIDRAFT_1049099 [Fomitopsis schrenkii]
MVLQRRFTLLAALTTLAAVSVLPPSVEGAVVPADYKEAEASTSTTDAHHSAHSHTLTHTDSAADHARPTSTDDDSDGKPQRKQQPVLPLPSSMSGSPSSNAKDGGNDEERHDSDSDKREVWDQSDYGLNGESWLANHDDDYLNLDMSVMHVPYSKRHDHDRERHHDEVIVNGDHDDVHMHRRTVHSRIRIRAPDEIADVSGGALPHFLPDDGLARRSSHDRHRHGEVVINGSNDNVHVPRSPHDHHDHDDDRHGHDEVVVNGDNDHVDDHYRRADLDPFVYVSDDHGSPYLIARTKRDGQQINGVPGSIDIMSEDPSSPNALKIASLVLSAPSNGTTAGNSTSTASSFVLNASGSDHTQMYLVATPGAANSTSPSNSTSADNSTSAGNSTDLSFIQVALQIPVFNEETAQMDPYCATFDPNPPAPSPLTVEECMANNTAGGEHKSQLFAFEPATGVIRPMWSSNSSDPSLDPDGSVSGPDNSTATTSAGSGPSSTASSSSSSATSSSDSASTATDSMSSAAPAGTNLAQDFVKNLEDDWTEATTPPSQASSAKAFDSDPASQARNVTLVFTPAAPVVAPAAGTGPIKAIAPPSGANGSGDDTEDSSGASGDDDDSNFGNDSGDDSDDDDDDGADLSVASSTMASGSSLDVSTTAPTASSTSAAAGTSDSASSTTTSSTGIFSDPAAKIASESASTTAVTDSTMVAMDSATTPTDSATTVTDSTTTATGSTTATDVTSTTAVSDSATMTSATTSTQNPSLAVEVYEPGATASHSGFESSSLSATDSGFSGASTASSTVTASGTDSSSSVVPTSSTSVVARQVSNASDSSAVASGTNTASASVVDVTGFAGKFREGTVVPETV